MNLFSNCRIVLVLLLAAVGLHRAVAQPAAENHLRLWVQNGYLPQVPVLVRVEVLQPDGNKARELWNAEATLTADDPGVTLSTNKIFLRNGLGSALVTFSGGGDFQLTAAVGSLLK